MQAALFLICMLTLCTAQGILAMCGKRGGGNWAVYGPCLASTCQRLSVVGIPSRYDTAFPGIPFQIELAKLVNTSQSFQLP